MIFVELLDTYFYLLIILKKYLKTHKIICFKAENLNSHVTDVATFVSCSTLVLNFLKKQSSSLIDIQNF